MDIRNMVRKALLKEGKHSVSNDYGCVMIFFDIDAKSWSSIQDKINNDDLYEGSDDESGYGKETDPHVTILYGIHTDVPDKDVEELIDNISEPKIILNKVSIFENEKFDVLKFDVKSEDLNKYNKEFKSLPHTDTFPDYNPHITIAYLKKGKADKYVKLLNKEKSIDIESDKIVYSKANGDKKNYEFK